MDVLEYSEDFGGPEDDYEFKRTIVVYEKAGSIYRAYSRKRYRTKNEIQLGDMFSTNKIQCALVFPKFRDTFTKAKETWIEEVKICEILKQNPHPNIAQYHGCAVVNDGSIRGIYFTKYDQTLMDKVNPARRNKVDFAYERGEADHSEIDGWLKEIELGLKHLHGLGIIHNDINPCNIMFQGETAVIIDFDSSRAKGHDLGLVKRTRGWHDQKTKVALPSNDIDALQEIK